MFMIQLHAKFHMPKLTISVIHTKSKDEEKFRTTDTFLLYTLQKNKYFNRYIFLGSTTIRQSGL